MIINNKAKEDDYKTFPVKNSGCKEYNFDRLATLSFTETPFIFLDGKFKTDIINGNFNDGYPINPIDTDDLSRCKRHIIELCKGNDIIMSMTVTENVIDKSKLTENKIILNEKSKAHFYIYRRFIFDIKCILNKEHYRELENIPVKHYYLIIVCVEQQTKYLSHLNLEIYGQEREMSNVLIMKMV